MQSVFDSRVSRVLWQSQVPRLSRLKQKCPHRLFLNGSSRILRSALRGINYRIWPRNLWANSADGMCLAWWVSSSVGLCFHRRTTVIQPLTPICLSHHAVRYPFQHYCNRLPNDSHYDIIVWMVPCFHRCGTLNIFKDAACFIRDHLHPMN